MPWDKQYSVYLEEIDAQHYHFFDLLDWVEDAAKTQTTELFPRLIEELVRYAKYHFACEEALMDAYDIEGKDHRSEHAKILAKIESMVESADFRPAALRLFLYKWLVVHTQLADLELADGVKEARVRIRQSCCR